MAKPVVEGEFTIASRLEEVSRIEHRLLSDMARLGYEGADCFAIKLALEEALANAIKHGNASDPAKQVTVRYQIDAEQVRVQVCDQGAGFTPDQVPDPTLDENLEKPFGRGVMLMRTYMSEVAFNEVGNCVLMIRRRNHAERQEDAS